MAQINKQPIIFPLSNPATQAECTFEQAMKATNHKVIFASGTAFPSYTPPDGTSLITPDQGNNMYIFPGLGMGAVLSRPRYISNRMIYAAAKALAESLTPRERRIGILYPSLNRIRDVSAVVAAAVMTQAAAEHLTTIELPSTGIIQYVKSKMWWPTSDDTSSASRI